MIHTFVYMYLMTHLETEVSDNHRSPVDNSRYDNQDPRHNQALFMLKVIINITHMFMLNVIMNITHMFILNVIINVTHMFMLSSTCNYKRHTYVYAVKYV